MRVVDVVIAFPFYVFVIGLVFVVGEGTKGIYIAFAVRAPVFVEHRRVMSKMQRRSFRCSKSLVRGYWDELVASGVSATDYPFEHCWNAFCRGGPERWIWVFCMVRSASVFVTRINIDAARRLPGAAQGRRAGRHMTLTQLTSRRTVLPRSAAGLHRGARRPSLLPAQASRARAVNACIFINSRKGTG